MKVSLITASYNSAATIADTLRSVRLQSYDAIEHIVVDGASRDETMAIVAREGSHLAQAISESDKGIYDAYNKGLGLVSGEIVGFLNSDDFYASPDVIAEVVAAFEDPSIDAVHADLVYVRADDTLRIVRHWKGRACTPHSLRRGFVPAHPTLFLRRSVYDRIGGFDTRYRLAADYEFMLRALHVHKIASRHVSGIWVRMRTGGATGGSLASIRRQNEEIRRAQDEHGIRYPGIGFVLHKLIDRGLQRLRAPFARVPLFGIEQ